MKLNDLLMRGIQTLEDAGIEEAKLDAKWMLMHFLHVTQSDLLAHGDREVDEPYALLYDTYIQKRAMHIPMQQLTHEQEFMGLSFYVDENVLVPRQDTELLVEEVMKTGLCGVRILDMCTGSGCILLSLLTYMNESRGMGVDLSDAALFVAKRNAEALSLAERAEFRQGDLFAAVDDGEKFDILVSNPPYIATKEIDGLMPEVKEHEPRMALDGGESGLVFYERIVADAKNYLVPGGKLYFEIGYDQGVAVSRLLAGAGFVNIEVHKDYAGLDRVVSADVI